MLGALTRVLVRRHRALDDPDDAAVLVGCDRRLEGRVVGDSYREIGYTSRDLRSAVRERIEVAPCRRLTLSRLVGVEFLARSLELSAIDSHEDVVVLTCVDVCEGDGLRSDRRYFARGSHHRGSIIQTRIVDLQ